MPLQATSGAASQDGFGGNGVPVIPNYIEEVFSTWLYTGTGSAQTITNTIDLSTNGGMVWFKCRSTARNHSVIDTVRGVGQVIYPDFDLAQNTSSQTLTAFNTTGFSIGTNASVSASGDTFASWTFRKQPKFFDVVTYTGDGTSPRAISHNLESAPGCVIIKQTNAANDWCVWHTATGNDKSASLNLTNAFATFAQRIKSVTSTTFSVGNSSTVNDSGATYVAYLFAHNAGGFGLTGTDNVISCGSFTTDGSGDATINLGYEAQWVLMKQSGGSGGNWFLFDNMRGMPVQLDGGAFLRPNLSNAETTTGVCQANSTGFFFDGSYVPGSNASATFIYIAIRRGPMKVPTSGTSVFKPNTTSAAAGTVVTTNFPVDLEIGNFLDNSDDKPFTDRLRGYATSTSSRTGAPFLNSPYTNAETTSGAPFSYNWWNTSVIIGNYISEYRQVSYYFGRAPSFFDEVCYTGTEVSGQTFNHNLGAMPEMMIVKARSGTTDWTVYHSALGASARIYLNATNAANTGTAAPWNSTAPTSTVFSLGDAGATNLSGTTFVNYLFATCAGVSKVGSYTGTGTTLQINCGFTGGARFVLIKRTDSTGSWYVWDSSRGIVSGNDPYLLLNSTAAEVTNTDYIDTYSAGFEISSTAPAEINASGGSFIFLAIS